MRKEDLVNEGKGRGRHDLRCVFLSGKEKIMKFAERIFERATVKGVADYLLYGMVPDKDDRSYETRLDDADLIYEKVAKQYGEDGASVDVDGEGVLRRRGAASVAAGSESAMQESIEDAIYAMEDLGADVVGFASGAPVDDLVALTNRARMSCGLPTLVQLDVASRDPEQEAPSYKNPYFDPDTMVDAAEALRAAGAQFLRAVGDASPAYTGALVAAVDRLDVIQVSSASEAVNGDEVDLDSLAERLRDRVASALGRTADRLDERHEQ